MKEASSEHRKTTALAMSTGLPALRRGYWSSKKRSPELFPAHISSTRSVTMWPGQMALTRTRTGPKSVAICLVAPITADLPVS